jgi:hypothetical protein
MGRPIGFFTFWGRQNESAFGFVYFESSWNRGELFIIMISALGNDQLPVFYRVNQPMFVVNSSAPKPGPLKFEWLGLADAVEGMTQYILYECIDPL